MYRATVKLHDAGHVSFYATNESFTISYWQEQEDDFTPPDETFENYFEAHARYIELIGHNLFDSGDTLRERINSREQELAVMRSAEARREAWESEHMGGAA